MAVVEFPIHVPIIPKTGKYDAAMARVRGQSKKTESSLRSLKGVAGTLFAGFTVAAVISQLGLASAAFADFEFRMAGVRAVTRALPEDMQKLEQQSRELGRSTIFTATQVAEAQENLARAGFDVAENLASLPAVLDLATSSELGMARAADISAGALRGFQLEASQMGDVIDVMAVAAADSNQRIEDMGEALKFAAPAAQGLGISFRDTTAALEVLADNMLRGTLGGTGLRMSLLSLIDPTGKAAGVLDELGVSAEEFTDTLKEDGLIEALSLLSSETTGVKEAIQIAGARGGTALQILLTNLDRLAEKRAGLEGITGASREMAEIKMDTATGSFKELESAIESARIELGATMAPALRETSVELKAIARVTEEWIVANRDILRDLIQVTGWTVKLAAALVSVPIKIFADVLELAGAIGERISNLGAAGADISGLTQGAEELAAAYRETVKAIKSQDEAIIQSRAGELSAQIRALAEEWETISQNIRIYEDDLDDLRSTEGATAEQIEESVTALRAQAVALRLNERESAELDKMLALLFESLNDLGAAGKEMGKGIEDGADAPAMSIDALRSRIIALRQAIIDFGSTEVQTELIGDAALPFDPRKMVFAMNAAFDDLEIDQDVFLPTQATMDQLGAQLEQMYRKSGEELAPIFQRAVAGLAPILGDLFGGDTGGLVAGIESIFGTGGALDELRIARQALTDIEAAGVPTQEELAQALDRVDVASKRTAAAFASLVSSLASSLQGSTGQQTTGVLGGQSEGTFSAEGADIGQAIGGLFGPWWGVFGQVVGGIIGDFIKKGADDAAAELRLIDGELDANVLNVEGGLIDSFGPFVDAFADAINQTLDMIGATLETLPANFNIEIRSGQWIAVWGRMFDATEEGIQDALSFAVIQLLTQGDVTGIEPEVRQALTSFVGNTLEGFQETLALALRLVDDRLGPEAVQIRDSLIGIFADIQAGLSAGISVAGVTEGIDVSGAFAALGRTRDELLGIVQSEEEIAGIRIDAFNAQIRVQMAQLEVMLAETLVREASAQQVTVFSRTQLDAVETGVLLIDTLSGVTTEMGTMAGVAQTTLEVMEAATSGAVEAIQAALADLEGLLISDAERAQGVRRAGRGPSGPSPDAIRAAQRELELLAARAAGNDQLLEDLREQFAIQDQIRNITEVLGAEAGELARALIETAAAMAEVRAETELREERQRTLAETTAELAERMSDLAGSFDQQFSALGPFEQATDILGQAQQNIIDLGLNVGQLQLEAALFGGSTDDLTAGLAALAQAQDQYNDLLEEADVFLRRAATTSLLDLGIFLAEGIGDAERLAELQAQQSRMELQLKRLEFELLVEQLRIFGLLDDELQGLVDDINSMFDTAFELGDEFGNLGNEINNAAGAFSSAASIILTGADLWAQQLAQGQALLDRIQQGLLAQQSPFARIVAEMQALRDEAMEITAAVFMTLGTNLADVLADIDLLEQMELDAEFQRLTGSLQDFFRSLTEGPLSGLSQRDQAAAAQARVEELLRLAAGGEGITQLQQEEAIAVLAAEGQNLLALAGGVLGAGGIGALTQQLIEAISGILGDGFPFGGGGGPLGPGPPGIPGLPGGPLGGGAPGGGPRGGGGPLSPGSPFSSDVALNIASAAGAQRSTTNSLLRSIETELIELNGGVVQPPQIAP